MAGYTRNFLVDAFADKYAATFLNKEDFFDFKIRMGYDFYDAVGKNAFRLYTGLDAQTLKQYKETLK